LYQIEVYRKHSQTKIEESFYRVANKEGGKSLTWLIAEYYSSSGKPAPSVGYRLRESIPGKKDYYRDNGWEVVRVEEYSANIPTFDFDEIVVCYCEYKPLPSDEAWEKKSLRVAPNLDSFGRDEAEFESWKKSQVFSSLS
jgi:hypothetical protein